MAAKFTANVGNAVADLASDKSEVDYIVCTFSDKTTLDVAEAGTGGRDAVVKYLEDSCGDKVATGSFLVQAVDDRGNTRSVRRKYIHFIWVGPKCGIMAKAKVASQSGAFKEAFAKTLTLSVQTDDLQDLSEGKLEQRLRAAGGAHQPTNFDFSNSSASVSSVKKPQGKVETPPAPAEAEVVEQAAAAELAASVAQKALAKEEEEEAAAAVDDVPEEPEAVEAEAEEPEPVPQEVEEEVPAAKEEEQEEALEETEPVQEEEESPAKEDPIDDDVAEEAAAAEEVNEEEEAEPAGEDDRKDDDNDEDNEP